MLSGTPHHGPESAERMLSQVDVREPCDDLCWGTRPDEHAINEKVERLPISKAALMPAQLVNVACAIS
jgi:hypothetical protein